jgi:hypothetical protein
LPSQFDGDGHYRCMFPARELERQRGWNVGTPPYVMAGIAGTKRSMILYGDYAVISREDMGGGQVKERRRLTKSAEDWLLDTPFDVLLMQCRAEPFWPQVIRRLQSQGKRVFVDSDDAWWGLPSWNPGSRKPPADVVAMRAQIAAADGLSVATPALAELYRPFQPNVRVIRNRLDWGMWADVTPVYERPSRRLRVGWMGDSEWRAGDLRVLRGVLGPWLKRNPDVEFVAAGDPRTHDILGVPVPQRVSVADCRFRNGDLADITATFDIGLIPLDLSTPAARRLNECKSHLKGAEYNACGIPFIASPSESYRWFGRDKLKGLLAETPSDWRLALGALTIGDARDYLGRVGGHCREMARRESIQHNVGEWEDWLGADHGSHPHPARTAAAA